MTRLSAPAPTWPDGLVVYRQTAEFTEETVPKVLLADHTTKEGVWGRIRVLEGRLRYRVPSLGVDVVLDAENPGTVLPGVPHLVTPEGRGRFLVEFARRAEEPQQG
jgi:tellurite methyltransferase